MGEISHRSAGDVIQNHREFYGLRNGFEMLVEAFLGWLVVIRHNLQRCLGTECGGLSGKFDCLKGGVRASSRDDGNAACGLFHGYADKFEMLVDIDRWRFARCADRHNPIGAFFDMPINQLAVAVEIETAIVKHWRGDRH